MLDGAEIPQSDLAKEAAKGVQAAGLVVNLEDGNFEVTAPKGADISPGNLKLLGDFINSEAQAHNLQKASPESQAVIADALGKLTGPGFNEDMVAYGPPLVGDAGDRMKRLKVARAAITAAQQEGLKDIGLTDRAGLIRSATFARKNISNLGLVITRGVLRAGSAQAQVSGAEVSKNETYFEKKGREDREREQRKELKRRDIDFYGSEWAVPESRKRHWESPQKRRDIAFYGSEWAVPESRKRHW